MRPNVVRFRGRGVINVAADVEIELLSLQFLDRNVTGVFRHAEPVAIDMRDLLNISSGRSEFWFLPSLYFRSALTNNTLFRLAESYLLMTSTQAGIPGP